MNIFYEISPKIDLFEIWPKIENMTWPFLFVYCPLITCILLSFKGVQYIFYGIRLNLQTRNSKFFRGKIIAKKPENGYFKETGRISGLKYPIIEYQYQGETYWCNSDKPTRLPVGSIMSIHVGPAGEDRALWPGILLMTIGIAITCLGIYFCSYVANAFRIFL